MGIVLATQMAFGRGDRILKSTINDERNREKETDRQTDRDRDRDRETKRDRDKQT